MIKKAAGKCTAAFLNMNRAVVLLVFNKKLTITPKSVDYYVDY